MCGIVGEIHPELPIRQTPEQYAMQQALVPRGPDQEGVYLRPGVCLMHTRLCVIDPVNGTQPMVIEEGGKEYAVVYNGELYNTFELRSELSTAGQKFRTDSDTEVLLRSYLVWGQDCVRRFNGIFAFAIWDADQKALLIARDRMGVKPFFYAQAQDGFQFASEIKALLKHPAIPARLSREGIYDLMLLGPGRTPGCGVLKGIHELLPGHMGIYHHGTLRIQRYWGLVDRPHTDTFPETVEMTRHLVTDAISRQLVSDVELGTFLSGGLDSSLISAIAAQKAGSRRLKTFSVTYRENGRYFQSSKFQPNSDDAFIDTMVDFLGSDHTYVTLDTPELIDALYRAVDARDLPGMADVDSSLWLFSREIKKQVTVALSGECADEIFGGYPWYLDPTIRERYGFPWMQCLDYRSSFLQPEFQDKRRMEDYVHSRYEQTVQHTHKLDQTSALEGRMKEMMQLNLQWFMQTLLDRKDRMSMAHGLEVRVPFCDHRIVEYLYHTPWAYKDYQGREKGLLREAMAGVLPKEILWRKKSPYPKTHHPSYLAGVSRQLTDLLHDPAAPIHQIVRHEAMEKLLQSQSSTPWYGQLMTTPQTIAYLLQLNYWLDRYQVSIV